MVNLTRLEFISGLFYQSMKRYVQIIGLVLLALGAGGWGAIVAATLCPHANPGMSVTALAQAPMREDHACCPEKNAAPEQQEAHCHDSGTGHEATSETGVEHDSVAVARYTGETEVTCAHCMGRSEVPTAVTPAHKPPQTKRGIQAATQTALSVTHAPSFTSPVLYRQGAPPGPSAPRHLLISVLLI